MDTTNPDVQRYLLMDRHDHELALGRLRMQAVSEEDPELMAAETAWQIRQGRISFGESADHEE